MARPKPKFVKIGCSVVNEPVARDTKCSMMLLAAYMQQRRFQDGLTLEEACRITLNRDALRLILGKSQPKAIRVSLESLASFVSLSWKVEGVSGEFISIQWPSFADYQASQSPNAPPTSPKQVLEESKRRERVREEKNTPSEPLRDSTRAPPESDSPQPEDPPEKPAKKVQPQAIDVTLRLVAQIPESMPGSSVPNLGSPRFDKWAREIDRLQRLDNGGAWTWEEINSVVTWLPTHDDGEFRWGLVVRSAKKFRQHFPRLMATMKNAGHKPETDDQRNLREVREYEAEGING
jgi:hypothetical protein